jgi:hypothetical protein
MATEIEATERSSAPRRFTLLDGMVLVAATAVGFSGVNAFVREIVGEDLSSILRVIQSKVMWRESALALLLCALPVLAAWTLALIPLRLLKPRPRSHRLAREPGLMAGLSFAITTGFLAILAPIIRFGIGADDWDHILRGTFMLMPAAVGVAVLASWTTLILSRRWRAEPSWIDRLGRAFGVFWVVFALASPLLLMIMR